MRSLYVPFFAAQRLADLCGMKKLTKGEATKQLHETLIHELGHVVEFQFQGKAFGRAERWHAEGFASWFETLGASYLPGGSENSRSRMRTRAVQSYHADWTPQHFRGSAEDYARAYSLIAAIADKRSILRLADTYKLMGNDNITLIEAIQRELGWNQQKLLEQAARNVGVPAAKK